MAVTSINKGDPSIANRYLADQLTQGEREVFEQRLLQDPTALRELEATARFKHGLRKLRESGKLEELVAERSLGQRCMMKLRAAREAILTVIGGNRHQRMPILADVPLSGRGNQPAMTATWLSAAAALAILVLGVTFLRWNDTAPPMMASTLSSMVARDGHPLSVAATYAVFRKRSSTDHDAVINLPPSQQAIELRVLPDSNVEPPYRVSLMQPQAPTDVPRLASVPASGAASVASLRPDGEGFVSVFIDSQQLAPGDYIVYVSGAGTDVGTQFLIRVNPSN